MTAKANSTPANEIDLDTFWWGIIARGTRESLIQDGITREGPFPGDPGEKKTICRTVDPLRRKIRIQRSSKYKFSVSRDWSDEEKALWEQRQKLDDERKKKEQKIQSARREVASWPKSAGDYRGRMQRIAAGTMDGFTRWLYEGYLGGYRFDDAALSRLYEITDELRELVEAGGIVMDPELRKKWTPDCITDELLEAAAPAPETTVLGGNVIPFRQTRC